MTLTSFDFLLFLPLTFLLYWFLFSKNAKMQNAFLVVASAIFYAWWDWRFLLLITFSSFTTFGLGILIDKAKTQGNRWKYSFIAILLNLGILFYFKYCNFFIQTLCDLLHCLNLDTNTTTLNIILPIGISFYTFSALSYIIDIYRRNISATHDLLAYTAYITFFPSILSGPINRAQKQLPQYFEKRDFNYTKAISACKWILWGIFMKLCLADRIGIYVDTIYSNIDHHSGTTLLFTSILYTIQIYTDFAGYSLIAIGSGQLLGIQLQNNFNRPYFSKTVTEFWRRWHISLTSWFRDYIYFSLGGNRVSKQRWIFNIMIVFIVSGIWHGAAYTFVLWGAIHGFCMVGERLIYGKQRLRNIPDRFTPLNLLRILITFNIVSLLWIFFRSPSATDAIQIIGKIFIDHGPLFIDMPTLSLAGVSFVLLILKDMADEWHWKIQLLNNKNRIIQFISCLLLLIFIMLFGVLDGGQFIYFQF